MEIDKRLVDFVKSDLIKGKVPGDLSLTYDLIDGEVLDSLGIMKLIIFLEENYGIKVSDDDLVPENFSSIMAIHALIEQKRGAEGAAP